MFSSLVFLFVLILINAFFAASEIALISLNDNKMKLMAEEGHKKAKLLVSLMGDPGKFLATIQIGITLAGFLASAFASESFADPLVKSLMAAGATIPEPVMKTVAVFLITVILAFFTLVLGELVPKRLAMQKTESIAMFVVNPLYLLSRITSPFVRFLTASTNFFVKLCGVDPHAQEEHVTEEEIRMMVDVGEENGSIHETEKEMINNIFEFNNKIAGDIMTHRTEIVGIRLDADLKSIMLLVNHEQFTRFPIYEDDIDNIIGILHVKDLLHLLNTGDYSGFTVAGVLRQPCFVPESKRIDELFREMKKNKSHMAVVIDEYGGTAGIITIEDLIEEIVGNIFDEYDEEEKSIERLDDATWLIDGATGLDLVGEFFDVIFPVDDYDTLSGFVVGKLGRIPSKDDKSFVEYANFIFSVESVEEKRIAKVKVTRKPSDPS